MKLVKPIFVLPLTLFNITQAFYFALDDGKATTSTSTCLRLLSNAKLLTRDCSAVKQFTLYNSKLCSKKEPTFCLSKTIGGGPSRTTFSMDTNRYIPVRVNSDGGYLYVDSFGGVVKKYKYSMAQKMFITDYDEPVTFPSSEGHWKFNTEDGRGNSEILCVTGNSKYDVHVVYLKPCRSSKDNKKQGNKIQFWKYEGGYIRSADGVWCLIVTGYRMQTIKCTSITQNHATVNILPGREIGHGTQLGMCLGYRMSFNRKILKFVPCVRGVKRVYSID